MDETPELIDDLRWIAADYDNRRKVEPTNPSSPMFQQFEAIEQRLQKWLKDQFDRPFVVSKAVADWREDWFDQPALELRDSDEAGNLRWPVIRLWLVLVPHTEELLLIAFDGRHQYDNFDYEPGDEVVLQQHEALSHWLIGPKSLAQWTTRGRKLEGLSVRYQVIANNALLSYRTGLDAITDAELTEQLAAFVGKWEEYRQLVRKNAVRPILRGEHQPSWGEVDTSGSEQMQLPEDYEPPTAINKILYGPPGTGKTYSTARRALALCEPNVGWDAKPYEEVMNAYRRLRDKGRIGVVTFHQSYGYEEFVEGIRPVLQSVDEESEATAGGDVRYRCETGIFKRMALLAASAGLTLTDDDQQFEARWNALLNKIQEAGEYETKSYANYRYWMRTAPDKQILIQRADTGSTDPTTYTVTPKSARRWWEHRDALGTNFKRIQQSFAREKLPKMGDYTPHWIIYRELSLLEPDAIHDVDSQRQPQQLTLDERIALARNYLTEGATGRFNQFEEADNYVLIIDEINRGNISKILGELITLLEATKRLTCDQEMIVTLPYSKEEFAVPPNLHLLGTMNTADRSIALMDVAIRRRFEFDEMMPDVSVIIDVLSHKIGGSSYDQLGDKDSRRHINLVAALFETMNERIRFLYDRDHQLGHSYFLEATDLESLRDTFVLNVIPLLQEYFYNSWDRVCLVLGCPYTRDGKSARSHHGDRQMVGRPIIRARRRRETDILLMDHDEFEDAVDYRVDPRLVDSDDDEELHQFFTGVLSPETLEAVDDGEYIETLEEISLR